MAVHADAIENIKFMKEQQWSLTNYTALLYGAIFGVSRVAKEWHWASYAGLGIVWLIVVGSSYLMLHMEGAKHRFRERLAAFNARYFSVEELTTWDLKPVPKPRFHDWRFLLTFLVIIIFGGVLTSIALIAEMVEHGPPPFHRYWA